MLIRVEQTLCAGCAMCIAACSEKAITCAETATIDSGTCTACLDCLAFCPTEAIVVWNPIRERKKRMAIAVLKENHAKTQR